MLIFAKFYANIKFPLSVHIYFLLKWFPQKKITIDKYENMNGLFIDLLKNYKKKAQKFIKILKLLYRVYNYYQMLFILFI